MVWNNRNLDVSGTFTGTKFCHLLSLLFLSPNIPKPLVYTVFYLLHWSKNGDDLKLGWQFTALKCMSQRQKLINLFYVTIINHH